MFAGIGGAAIDAILAVMDFKRYRKGDIICQQGAEADRFYVIVSGKCKVEQCVPQMRRDQEENVREMVHVGDLRALDVMGENALVSCSGPEEVAHFRSATVTVVSDLVQTLELHRSEFEALKDSGVLGAEFTEKVQSIKQERERMNEALRRQNQGISA